MPPEPVYRAAELHPAYQLRYGWTGWPSQIPFPVDQLSSMLGGIAPEWEKISLAPARALLIRIAWMMNRATRCSRRS